MENVNLRVLKSQGSYGYLLPVELAEEVIGNKKIFLVGEDLESEQYAFEIFDCIEDAEEAFEKRLQERRR